MRKQSWAFFPREVVGPDQSRSTFRPQFPNPRLAVSAAAAAPAVPSTKQAMALELCSSSGCLHRYQSMPQRPCGRQTLLPWSPLVRLRIPVRHTCLSVIDKPPPSMCHGYFLFLMSGENGGLEFADVEDEESIRLRLYTLETAPDGVAQWAQGRTFELELLLPDVAIPAPRSSFVRQGWAAPRADVLGFAEGTDVIFVGTATHGRGIYMIQLNSGKVRKVFDDSSYVIPFTSFCIPVMDEASSGERPRTGFWAHDECKLLVQGLLNQMGSVPYGVCV